MSSIVLDLRHLTRHFGDLVAVDGLTFTVGEGEIFALLGPPGAGRSTTLRMLTTVLPPSGGQAFIAGLALTTHAAGISGLIGHVPQPMPVEPTLTGYENLILTARSLDLSHHERETRIREALAHLGLTADADHLVREYTAGMVRRLEIARATLHRPRILFLDEPTIGLDQTGRHLVWKHLLDLRANHGTTLVFSTDRPAEAETHADRVAVLSHGVLVALGTPAALAADLRTLADGALGGVLMRRVDDHQAHTPTAKASDSARAAILRAR